MTHFKQFLFLHKWLLIVGICLFAANATAGTILLLKIGKGTPGAVVPGTCNTGAIDLSTGCAQPSLFGL